jgi:hypothetical protein
MKAIFSLLIGASLGTSVNTASFISATSQSAVQQQSHNCNSNIDRLKKGPHDWTQIEGSGKPFTDSTFPADETMLSWKEYPRTVNGLSRYLSWFTEFKRPKDMLPGAPVSLFGHTYEHTGRIDASNIE